MTGSRAEKLFITLAILGALLAAYAISLHYKDGGSICDINETLSCDVVNKSPWSTFFGIPVAILGMLAYAVITLLVLKKKALLIMLGFTEKDFWQYILVLVGGMFLFQAYLTYVEAVHIGAYCVVCLGSQVIVLALVTISLIRFRAN